MEMPFEIARALPEFDGIVLVIGKEPMKISKDGC